MIRSDDLISRISFLSVTVRPRLPPQLASSVIAPARTRSRYLHQWHPEAIAAPSFSSCCCTCSLQSYRCDHAGMGAGQSQPNDYHVLVAALQLPGPLQWTMAQFECSDLDDGATARGIASLPVLESRPLCLANSELLVPVLTCAKSRLLPGSTNPLTPKLH